MISFNSNMTHQIATRMASNWEVYCFSGPVPSTIAEIPFDLFIDCLTTVSPQGTQRQRHAVNLYSNMVCHLSSVAKRDISIGFDHVEWSNGLGIQKGLTKASYYDNKRQEFIHIPQKIDSDLVQYDCYSGTNYTIAHMLLSSIFWPTGEANKCKMNIPAEHRENGFFIEADFEYEANITGINFTSNGSQFFTTDCVISRWDPTLLAGAGDWVVFETHQVFDTQVNNNLIFSSDLTTTKVRIDFAKADTSHTVTEFILCEFVGTEPQVALPVIPAVTWALTWPTYPDSGMYNRYTDEPPFMLVTAGGPSDSVELKINKSTPERGRASSLLGFKMKFIPEEY